MNCQDAMKMKHQHQIAAHEHAFGSKLGTLKTHPTKKQLDDAYLAFRNEKYGTNKKPVRSERPKRGK